MPKRPRKSAKTSAKDSTQPKRLYCALVLDESGSMALAWGSTISGANAWVNDQKADGPKDILLVNTFTGREQSVKTILGPVPMGDARAITYSDYAPNGGTPLYDALGKTIAQIEADPQSRDRNVILVVMTDGQENASVEFDHAAITALIQRKESEGWRVMYLDASGRDVALAKHELGLSAQAFAVNTSNLSPGLTNAAYAASSTATRMFRAGYATNTISATLNNTAATEDSLSFGTDLARAAAKYGTPDTP